MQWFKYSLIIMLLGSSVYSHAAKFTSKSCLDAKLSTKIEHKGKFFGLLENRITIEKHKCLVKVTFKGILETVWKIDVCREPIHMKVTSKGSQDVYKRNKKCEKSTKSDYCYYRNELMEDIQDHGLIFATGDREDLSQSHGKAYCAFLLLQRYLDDGIIFSTYETPRNIYKTQTACAVPNIQKVAIEESSQIKKTQDQPSEGASSRGLRPDSPEEDSQEDMSDDRPRF